MNVEKSKSAKQPGEPLIVRLATTIFLFLTWPLAWLPHRLGMNFGALIGRLIFLLASRRRNIALTNIKMVQKAGGLSTEFDPEHLARSSFANMGSAGWETICLLHRGLAPFEQNCSVESGEAYFQAAQAEAKATGKGILLATGHLGNWELMCQYFSKKFNFKPSIVGRSQGGPFVDALVTKLRTRNGNQFIFKTGGAKAMLAVLKGGGVLGTMVDQAAIVNHEGVAAKFLGLEAMTNMGPIRLARRTGSKIILLLFRREGRRHFITVCPPLEFSQNQDQEAALLADVQALNDCLSDFIARHPEEWLWGHRRWKTAESVAQDADAIF